MATATAKDQELTRGENEIPTVSRQWWTRDRAQLMSLRDVADTFIEAPIVTSLTRIGYESRRRVDQWTQLSDYDLTGRVIVLTGATSGLGKAAANRLARCDATLVLVGRNPEQNQTVVPEMIEAASNDAMTKVPADLDDFDQVRALAESVLSEHDRLDVLIHNARTRPAASKPPRPARSSARSCSLACCSTGWKNRRRRECRRCRRVGCTAPVSPSRSSKWLPGSTREPAADPSTGRRHAGLARVRRLCTRIQRAVLARSPHLVDTQAVDHKAVRDCRTQRPTVDLGRRNRWLSAQLILEAQAVRLVRRGRGARFVRYGSPRRRAVQWRCRR